MMMLMEKMEMVIIMGLGMVAMVMMMLMVFMVMVMLMVPTRGRNAELPLLEDVGDAVEARVGANDEGIRAPVVVQVEANDGHVRGLRHRSRHCRRRCMGRSISHRGCVCHRRCCDCGCRRRCISQSWSCSGGSGRRCVRHRRCCNCSPVATAEAANGATTQAAAHADHAPGGYSMGR